MPEPDKFDVSLLEYVDIVTANALEMTRKSFKSKELEALRKDLEEVLLEVK